MTDLQKRMTSISGSGVITVTEDALEINAEGQWFFFFEPGELGPGSPAMALITRGLTYVRGDADGRRSRRSARRRTSARRSRELPMAGYRTKADGAVGSRARLPHPGE